MKEIRQLSRNMMELDGYSDIDGYRLFSDEWMKVKDKLPYTPFRKRELGSVGNVIIKDYETDI